MNILKTSFFTKLINPQNQVMPPQASINQLSPQMPYNVIQQNNNLQPTHSNFPTTPAANLTMYQQHTGYQELPAPVQQRVLETPMEKPTLPEEFIYMQTLFEELKTQCLAEASDPVNIIQNISLSLQ